MMAEEQRRHTARGVRHGGRQPVWVISTKGAATLGRATLGKHLERQQGRRRGEAEGKAGVGEDRLGRKSDNESDNEREKEKRGQKEVRATSRTICPGWPRRGGRKGRMIEEERRQKGVELV